MPADWTEQTVLVSVGELPGKAGVQGEQFLLQAFRSFAAAAASLEQSYRTLRGEVERLRSELAESNSDLARSFEENRNMRMRLNRILESLPCGVLVVESNGDISMANPEALRLAAKTGSGAPPTSMRQLPIRTQQLLDDCRDGRERELMQEGGVHRWLAARYASLAESADGTSIFILRDVTERKHLEEAHSRHRRDQALAEMSALLAHEIRNPLGSLELFAGLLAESNLEEEPRQWIEHVQAGLRTLAATVNNVLHFHSLPEPQRVPVDLGGLLAWAKNFFTPLAKQSGITLSLQNGLQGVELLADRHRLEQVLLNLVLNAVRAVPRGGWIELAGCKTRGGSAVALSVSDTGPGIPSEDLRLIFDPGFTRRPGSPGLGLAVCRKIVQQHAATIVAANRAEGGAVFTVTFPFACRPEKEKEEVPE